MNTSGNVRNLILLVMLLAGTLGLSYASYPITVVQPFNATVYNNGSVYLGKVGPGQTFYVTINSTTVNSTGFVFNRGWNKLVVTNLPPGWIAVNSSLYTQELSVELTPPPEAVTGEYQFNLTAVNLVNYSKLGSETFRALINVTPNVFVLRVTPSNISTGPGQPADVYITINNTGVSDSQFVISASGLPAWNSTRAVIALHHTSENFTYPIYLNEPGIYQPVINVNSTASPLVHASENITFVVQASVLNDYRAIGQGTIAFPVIYEPAYAIMYIIGKLLGG